MRNSFVPTVEEIRERIAMKARGVTPPDFESKKLRDRVAELEKDLEVARGATKDLSLADIRGGVDAIFRKYGVEPTEEVIRILQQRDADGNYVLQASDRVKIWMDLMQYRHPKLRSVEHSGAIKSDMTLVVMRFSDGAEIERKPLKLEQEAIEVESTKGSEMLGAPEKQHED